MTAGLFVAFAAGLLLAALLAVGRLYLTFRCLPRPSARPASPDSPPTPPAVTAHLQDVQRQLYPAGFNIVACLRLETPGPRASYLALLENPRTRDRALAGICLAPGRRIHSRSLQFLSEFQDGATLLTANTPLLAAPAAPRHGRLLCLPHQRDALTLYRIHERLIAEQRPGIPRRPLHAADPARLLATLLLPRLYDRMLAGLLILDDQTGLLRPTLRGAFHLAWQDLGPPALLRLLRDRLHARALLAATPSPPSPSPWHPAWN